MSNTNSDTHIVNAPKKWRILRRLGGLALASVSTTVVWLAATNLLAQQVAQQVEQDWQEMNQRFPHTEPNATAQQLDATIAKLGIAPMPTQINTVPVNSQQRQTFQAMQLELQPYFAQQLQTFNDRIAPLPAKVGQFITQHRADLDATITLLNQSEIPTWGFSAERRQDKAAQAPTGLYHSLALQKLLLVDGLAKTRNQDPVGAAQAMAAAWKINQGLAQDPSLVGQTLKALAVKQQALVLRKMQNLPADWPDRLAAWQKSDPAVFLSAMQMEQLITARMLRQSSQIDRWAALFASYWQASSGDMALKTTQLTQAMLAQDVCAFDDRSIQAQAQLAWWNHPSVFRTPTSWADYPGLTEWPKIAVQMLQLQLTQKVLQAKAIAAQQGQFPRAIPDIAASVCQNVVWRYQVGANGTATIDLPHPTDFAILRGISQREPLKHQLTGLSQPMSQPQNATSPKPKPTKSSGKL